MAVSRLVMELLLIDGASAVARRAASSLRGLGAEGEQAFSHMSRAVDQFRAGMRGLSVARQLKAEIVDPGVEAAASLQSALTGLEVTLAADSVAEVRRQLEEARQDAARVASPTAFSQEEVVGIQTSLSKAGLGIGDIAGAGGAAEAVAQLATAEQGLGASGATDAVLTMGSIFRLAGDEFATAADELVRASGAAAVDPRQLSESLSQAPTAGALGLERSETLAALGVMGNMGIKGGSAGTALNAFLRQAATSDKKYGLGLYDEGGSFVGLQAAAESLRASMDGRTQQQQQVALSKAFGDEGARFALALLQSGSGGLEDTLRKMEQAATLQDRVNARSQTFNASSEAVSGSGRSLLAALFTPALEPLTAGAKLANDALGQLADEVESNPALARGASYGALGTVAAAGTYGMAQLARGGLSLGRGLQVAGGAGLLRSLLGTAGGVAAGKAAEAATGTTPVFVTNWPATLGMPNPTVQAAQGGAAAAGGLGRTGAALGAGAAGFAVGTAIQEGLIKNTWAEDVLQASVAQFTLMDPGMGAGVGMAGPLLGAGFSAAGVSQDDRRAARNEAINRLFERFELNVHIDSDGRVRTEARVGDVQRAWSRDGAI